MILDGAEVSLALEFSVPEEPCESAFKLKGDPGLEVGSRALYLVKPV